MDINNLLKDRDIDLKFVENLQELFNEMKDGDIITNDHDFTKTLLLKAGFKNFYLVRDASLQEVEDIKTKIKGKKVIGFGGGKAIDIAKKVSFDLDLTLFSCPTAPSHDGLVSKNCSLYNKGKKETIPTKYPKKIIIPLHLWKTAGILKKAGICDLFSNFTALQDLSLAETKGEKFIDFYKKLSFEAVKPANLKDDKILALRLIISGIAMEKSSCYCSGSEHEVEKLLESKMKGKYLHGQLVGTGLLISAKIYSIFADNFTDLRFDPKNLFEKIKQKMKENNVYNFALMPLSDKNFNPEFLKKLSKVRPERYTLWNFIDSEKIDWIKLFNGLVA